LPDPGAAAYPADDPGGAVPVQSAVVSGEEDWPFAALDDSDHGHLTAADFLAGEAGQKSVLGG
jgi:hypothetical protein